ncbi:MAG: hypothetical protein AB7G93_13275 [Bdellovibrionales bacterium]
MYLKVLTFLFALCSLGVTALAESRNAEMDLVKCIARGQGNCESLIKQVDVSSLNVTVPGAFHIDRSHGSRQGYRDKVSITLLGYAASLCQESVVKALLEKGADPNTQFSNSRSQPRLDLNRKWVYSERIKAADEARHHLQDAQKSRNTSLSEKCDSTLAHLEKAESKSGFASKIAGRLGFFAPMAEAGR